MPPAVAAAAVVGGIGLVGGIVGNNAANHANAQQQTNAENNAQKNWKQAQANIAPWTSSPATGTVGAPPGPVTGAAPSAAQTSSVANPMGPQQIAQQVAGTSQPAPQPGAAAPAAPTGSATPPQGQPQRATPQQMAQIKAFAQQVLTGGASSAGQNRATM